MHRSLPPPLPTAHARGGGGVRQTCRVCACAPPTTRRRGARDLCPSSPLSSGADSAPRSQRPLAAESCDVHLPRRRRLIADDLAAHQEPGGPWGPLDGLLRGCVALRHLSGRCSDAEGSVRRPLRTRQRPPPSLASCHCAVSGVADTPSHLAVPGARQRARAHPPFRSRRPHGVPPPSRARRYRMCAFRSLPTTLGSTICGVLADGESIFPRPLTYPGRNGAASAPGALSKRYVWSLPCVLFGVLIFGISREEGGSARVAVVVTPHCCSTQLLATPPRIMRVGTRASRGFQKPPTTVRCSARLPVVVVLRSWCGTVTLCRGVPPRRARSSLVLSEVMGQVRGGCSAFGNG
jgi:hypothetical protein